MQKTGIVRRFDDLGKIVIPREVRTAIGIREGDPFEISYNTETSEVLLTKYKTVDYRKLWDALKNDETFLEKMNEMEEAYIRDNF